MTSEDIESVVDILVGAVRKLVLRAYEEAARVADSYESGRNGDPSDMIAADIRALKDSL